MAVIVKKGRVKWFDAAKGYGFITPTAGKDIFVHYSNIVTVGDSYKSLDEHENVEYEEDLVTFTGRPQAINVVSLDRIVKNI
jgi:CspA family cold shock protein